MYKLFLKIEDKNIRNIKLHNGIIEKYVLDASEEGINISEILKERTNGFNEIEIEVGSGNGKFLTEHALERPNVYFIGLEYSFKAIKKSVDKAAKRDIKNMTVIYGDANTVIDKYIKENIYSDKLYLNFPDPWPKKRHHHRRIFNENFSKEVHSVLKPGGIFYLVTDDKEYAEEIMSPTMEKSNIFENTLSSSWVQSLEGYKKTLYEQKMRSMGKEIYFMVYKKV